MASALSPYGFTRYHPQHHPVLVPPLAVYPEPLSPLDLSVKASAPITPPCTPSPPRKLPKRGEDNNNDVYSSNGEDFDEAKQEQTFEKVTTPTPPDEEMLLKTPEDKRPGRESPEIDVVDHEDRPKKIFHKGSSTVKKNKAVRRLVFDEDKSSPVSGTIIRELADDETLVVRKVSFCFVVFRQTLTNFMHFVYKILIHFNFI